LATGWTYHQVASSHRSDPKRYARTGRPTPRRPVKAIDWHIQAHVRPAEAALAHQKHRHACLVIGTHIGTSELPDTEVMTAYTRQSQVEGGFRFRKDPLLFVASLLVKKPCRRQGLLLVLTLAFLVYAVAQRRLRQPLAPHQDTVPNHSNQPTTTPTLRGVCQLLEGIHRVRMTVQAQVHDLLEGLNDVQLNVLRLFGEAVCRLYQISPG
jgi:transposase